MHAPKPTIGFLSQPLILVLLRQDLGQEPVFHLFGVSHGRFTETEERANLRSMVFNTPALPVVLQIGFWSHAHLSSDKRDHDARYLVFERGEASCPLKKLEQHRKSQACCSGFVAQLGQIPSTEHPVLNEFLIFPLSF